MSALRRLVGIACHREVSCIE